LAFLRGLPAADADRHLDSDTDRDADLNPYADEHAAAVRG
jgi:hypothetical protein